MLETIKRNREALGLSTSAVAVNGLKTINSMLPIDAIARYNKQGVEYTIADGLIVGIDQ